MRYVIAIFISFTLGTAMAHKYDVEPEEIYKERPLRRYTSYEGIHCGFKEK